ncbi:hypothetical protein ES703_12516 [subsurface metagenome]
MSPAKVNPCLEGLTVDCFAHNPQWAKQAFAYRLLHTITPKKLTRRLPKGLRIALLAPGITLPPGIELPPGTTVPPGAEIPATWTPDQPTPPGTQPPPTTPPGTETGGIVPPIGTAPWEPGPISQPGKQPAPSVVYWFYEPFDDLTTNSWSDISHSGGSAGTPAAELKLKATFPGAYSAARRTHATAWPTNWTLEFSLNYYSGAGVAQIELYTGAHRVRIFFTPPTTVDILPASGTCQATVDNYLNQVNTWKLVVTGSTATLYQNGAPVITACGLFEYSFFAGRMEVEASDAHEAYIDWLTIVED